jgi:hypothetical protein
MQNIKAGGLPARSGDRDEMYRTVVSELASVIDRIRKSLGLIESAIAGDAAGEDAAADNVIELDDVTPSCYERVDAALRNCDAGLSVALRLLQGPMTPGEAA